MLFNSIPTTKSLTAGQPGWPSPCEHVRPEPAARHLLTNVNDASPRRARTQRVFSRAIRFRGAFTPVQPPRAVPWPALERRCMEDRREPATERSP